MPIIKNFASLNKNRSRDIALQLIEEAFSAIQPRKVMSSEFRLENSQLFIHDARISLADYERVFVVGFGKGSASIAQIVEETLGDRLTEGYVIDTVQVQLRKIHFTLGTHPLPSEQNVQFTQQVLSTIKNLSEKDLVLVIICGGGSALFEAPYQVPLARLTAIDKELLRSGASIHEMNMVRKHLSLVKGGGLAKHLYPARILGLIFSDVPGNDLSTIASGPTVKDATTLSDIEKILEKYQLTSVNQSDFTQTPTDDKYFQNVTNIIMVSNMTALLSMQEKARSLGYKATILTDRLEADAKKIGKVLLSETRRNEILLAGGETTVTVKGNGRGGRNQTLVLAALPYLSEGSLIASFDSDGWDFAEFAGAIGDLETLQKAQELGLDTKIFLDNDNSTEFFEKVGDGITTGRLESNVSDLMIVVRL